MTDELAQDQSSITLSVKRKHQYAPFSNIELGAWLKIVILAELWEHPEKLAAVRALGGLAFKEMKEEIAVQITQELAVLAGASVPPSVAPAPATANQIAQEAPQPPVMIQTPGQVAAGRTIADFVEPVMKSTATNYDAMGQDR